MKVEQENFFLAMRSSVQRAASLIGHELAHGIGEVGVDDDGVGRDRARGGTDADGVAVLRP